MDTYSEAVDDNFDHHINDTNSEYLYDQTNDGNFTGGFEESKLNLPTGVKVKFKNFICKS